MSHLVLPFTTAACVFPLLFASLEDRAPQDAYAYSICHRKVCWEWLGPPLQPQKDALSDLATRS
jgi:hypothetical protein